jgi:hypothetical protein
MHSTSRRSSLSERLSGLPRMPWQLGTLQWVQVVFAPVLLATVLLLVGEQRRRPKQRRRVRQPR